MEFKNDYDDFTLKCSYSKNEENHQQYKTLTT